MYISDDIDSTITITPSHFLCLNPKIGIPETVHGDDDPDYTPYESSERNVLQIWKKEERLINQFWKAWRDDYLLSLRERTQYKLKSGRIQSHQEPNVDDIVIVKDETPRGSWKLAKIVELNVSRDGLVRSAVVKLGSGRNLVRPLCLLYPLECPITVQKPLLLNKMTLRMTLSKFVNRRGEQQTLPEGRFRSVLTKYKRRYVTLLKDLDNYL